MDEHIIATCFRCYRGKGYYLGVKSPWWAKNIESEEEGVAVNLWKPSVEQITLADKVLFDVLPMLTEYERSLLICRCGGGFLKSYRKCGKEKGVHHEVFRQEFQYVIEKVQKIVDEIA